MSRVRGNSVELALNKILKKVNDYELASGDFVSDLELAKELNMSRTPIREAILKLIEFGILERTPTKVAVKAVTLSDIQNILEVREAIELMSVKIIYKRGGLSKSEINSLNAIHQKLCDDISLGNYERNFVHDFAFHEMLVSYSHNDLLIDICNRINMQSQRLRWISLLTPARYSYTRAEHEEIINSLIKIDLAAAQSSVQNHIEQTLQNYIQILNNKQWNKIMHELKHMNI